MITTILARIIVEQDVSEISTETIKQMLESGKYSLSIHQFEINPSSLKPNEQTFLLTDDIESEKKEEQV